MRSYTVKENQIGSAVSEILCYRQKAIYFILLNYKFKFYLYFSHCTTDGSQNGNYWCATSTYGDGRVVPGSWDTCSTESKHKLFT